jgi:uncharacterized membrane protein YccC
MSGRNGEIAVVVVTLWAFGAGMLVALSAAAADLGVMSIAMLVIYSGSSQAIDHPLAAGLLAFAGGLIQTALSLVSWPLRRYLPERRALSDLYKALSAAAAKPIQASQSPPASAQSSAAQSALTTLDRDDSSEGVRFRALLNQAERMRVSVVALSRLRIRVERENPSSPEVSILDRYLQACAAILQSIASALLSGVIPSTIAEQLKELDRLGEEIRVVNAKSEARFQMDAFAGQLRAAADLADHSTPAGLEKFEQSEAAKPLSLRLGGRLATLRANLNLSSAAFRHALRLAVCVGLGDALARGFGLQRSYWLPMTIAIILKPDFTATFSRGVLRLAGTFAGLVLATILFHVLPPNVAAQVVAVGGLMFVLRYIGPANYGVFVTAVTALVVFLIAMSSVSPGDVIVARAWNTLAGGAIALLAYWLWPTWERTQFSEAMARTLDSYRLYFRAVREAYLQHTKRLDIGIDRELEREVSRTRLAGRLARSNLEASIERIRAEPGTPATSVALLNSILATILRLAHALLAFEAGLYSGSPAPPRDAFRPFADHVELTLYHLAAALRGSPVAPDSLPDLREDHHALVHSAGSEDERYAFVNTETDRITNSLNTLSEELRQWVTSPEEVKAV